MSERCSVCRGLPTGDASGGGVCACGPLVALFCGSRSWTDREAIRRDVASLPAESIVLEGGGAGAERIARSAAEERGLHVATVRPLFERFARDAPRLRDGALLRLRPDVVFAYRGPLGGAIALARMAESRGVPVLARGGTG
jgi:hypothetical protein